MGDVGPCDPIDTFRNQVYSTMYSIITVFGLLGNGLALLVLLRTYKKRSPFQVYMLNLAVSDLLCISTLPFRILYYANQGQWYLGDFLCRITSYAFYVNLYCSILIMAAMSVTRFLAIVYPVQNLRLVTERRARLVCVAVWIFVCSASSPFLITGQSTDPSDNKTKCFEPPTGNDTTKLVVLNYLSLSVGFLLPFLIILVCYAGIIRALVLRQAASGSQQGVRAIRMIVIVMVTFLVSFTPYHVQRSVHLGSLTDGPCEKRIFMQKLVVVTLSLATSNCCFDPLLYFFSGEGFRSRLSTIRRSVGKGVLTSREKAAEALAPDGGDAGANELQRMSG
ncbi:hypothetical protein CRUP_029051 [Coryphaenoides rupestris]|nr:hypothetical protein CRUP_029051 [Coryphaenoides rupestris]